MADLEIGTVSTTNRPLRVAFVTEQHVGLKTQSDNMRRIIDQDARIADGWTSVDYQQHAGHLERLPLLPDGVRSSLRGRAEVRRGIDAFDPEVCFFMTQVPAALGGRSPRSRPYVVMTDVTPKQYDGMAAEYGHRPDRSSPLSWWKDQVNRRVFSQAHHCIAWSSWTATSIIDDYGADPSAVSVVPPGVDTTLWRPVPPRERSNAARPRIMFVGGDFERKGGPDLLDAFATLSDRCELVVVTSDRSTVPTPPGVRVVTDLVANDPALIELVRTSDIFALPSRAETFGIAALEASACGVPLVVSSSGGLGEIVEDQVTGYTVPVRDPFALRAALEALLDDPERRLRMGEAARRRAEATFDISTNSRTVADLVLAAGG